jgi:hypothetical protein
LAFVATGTHKAMPGRRREVVTHEVGPEPPRRPPPWAFDNSWALAGLILLAGVAGLLIWLFAIRDDGDETATTQTVTTQAVSTATTTTATSTTAPVTVTVPDLTGQPFAQAADAAAGAGLAADSYPVESSEPRGTVVAQTPDAGTTANEGDPMRLNVSVGTGERATTTVPDVTGPEAPEARATLADAKLTVRTVERAAPEPDNVNEVILQKPDAGASVPELTQVTIYVGR